MKDDTSGQNPPRRRGLTDMTLGWIAERFRRAQRIKEKVDSGEYQVDTDKVAASILNVDPTTKK